MENTGVAILGRLIEPDEPSLSPDAARSRLALTFRQSDRDRVTVLSLRAQEGTLTPDVRAELDEYLRVGDLLALLKSKARLSLKRAGVAP